MGEDTARFVAALDTSIAHGDLQTDSQDLAHVLGRPPTSLADAVQDAYAGAAENDRLAPSSSRPAESSVARAALRSFGDL